MGASRRRIRLGRKMSLMLGALLIAMLALTWTASAATTKSINGKWHSGKLVDSAPQ